APGLRVSASSDGGGELRIVVASGADGFRGSLRLRDRDGYEVERSVAGADCRELVAALALIVAGLGRSDAAATEPSPVAPPSAAPPPRAPTPERSTAPIAPPSPSPRASPRFDLRAALTARSAVAPQTGLGVDVGAGVSATADGRAPGWSAR